MPVFYHRTVLWLIAGVAMYILAIPVDAHAIARKGEKAPPFKVVSTSGQPITLANYTGKVLLIDFFATWCGPCKETIPRLVDLNRRYGSQGLQILGLSADDDSSELRTFIDDEGFTYPAAMAGESLLHEYGVRSIPMMIIIDRKGVVAEKLMGLNSVMEKNLEVLIKRLLAEK